MKSIKPEELKYLDEVDILYPKPKKFPVGNKFVLVKEMPLKNLNTISELVVKKMKRFSLLRDIQVPDGPKELKEETEKFENSIDIIEEYLKVPTFRKFFIKLLKIAMPELGKRGFASARYLNKNMTATEAIQILIAVWTYNFVSDCKKKVKELAKQMLEV